MAYRLTAERPLPACKPQKTLAGKPGQGHFGDPRATSSG